jgi:hypothetical protein
MKGRRAHGRSIRAARPSGCRWPWRPRAASLNLLRLDALPTREARPAASLILPQALAASLILPQALAASLILPQERGVGLNLPGRAAPAALRSRPASPAREA